MQVAFVFVGDTQVGELDDRGTQDPLRGAQRIHLRAQFSHPSVELVEPFVMDDDRVLRLPTCEHGFGDEVDDAV